MCLDKNSIEIGLKGQKFLVLCLFWGGCHNPNLSGTVDRALGLFLGVCFRALGLFLTPGDNLKFQGMRVYLPFKNC